MFSVHVPPLPVFMSPVSLPVQRRIQYAYSLTPHGDVKMARFHGYVGGGIAHVLSVDIPDDLVLDPVHAVVDPLLPLEVVGK